MLPRPGARALVSVVLFLSPLFASCCSTEGPRAMGVGDGETRLASLLRERGVSPDRPSAPVPRLPLVWHAFKEFAAVPVRPGATREGSLADGLLFEFGIFDFGGEWDETFRLSFARQLATVDGGLRQVHLVAHFPPAALETVRSRIGVVPCTEAARCATRCAFEATDALVGAPCALSLDTRRDGSTGRDLASASVWSFDTGGSGAEAQRMTWIAFVESSPVFRVVAGDLEPLGYEVWQDSVD